MIWTAGQTIKFALSVGRYMSRNLREIARRPPPSATVITEKNIAIPVDNQYVIFLVPIGSFTYRLGQISVDRKLPSSKPDPVH